MGFKSIFNANVWIYIQGGPKLCVKNVKAGRGNINKQVCVCGTAALSQYRMLLNATHKSTSLAKFFISCTDLTLLCHEGHQEPSSENYELYSNPIA